MVTPPEKHVFEGSDYECSICHRTRAMHEKDGFVPCPDNHSVSMDERVRYGPHPYFYKPGSLKLTKKEQERARLGEPCKAA